MRENWSSGFPTRYDTNRAVRWLEAGNAGSRKKRDCTIQVAKTKALISFSVTLRLCFYIGKILFSHDATRLFLNAS